MPIDIWFQLARVPLAVAVVAATVILVRRRHRSRRATVLAGAALCGLAGEWLFNIVVWYGLEGWVRGLSPDAQIRLALGMGTAGEVWRAACVVLLVCAVVADRQPTKPSGPEADYRDTPTG